MAENIRESNGIKWARTELYICYCRNEATRRSRVWKVIDDCAQKGEREGGGQGVGTSTYVLWYFGTLVQNTSGRGLLQGAEADPLASNGQCSVEEEGPTTPPALRDQALKTQELKQNHESGR